MTAGLPLMKSVYTPIIPLWLKAAASPTAAAIQKKMFWSCMTALIISNEEMDNKKIVKSLEKSGLLIKDVSETIKNEAREQKGAFLSILLGTLGTSLLGNMLTGKEVIMLPRPLTNSEIQKYCENKPRNNGVYSRNNLPKIKDGAYVTNVHEYESIEFHWLALYVNGENVEASNDETYFDSFGSEYISKEIKKFIGKYCQYILKMLKWKKSLLLFVASIKN